jgi:hypothetical protein
MAILFDCPCGTQVEAEDQQVGREVRCPVCREVLLVPSASTGTFRSGTAAPPPRVTPLTPERPPPRRSEERGERWSRRDDEDDRGERRSRREDDRGERWSRRDEDDRELERSEATSGKAITALLLGLLALGSAFSAAAPLLDSWNGMLILVIGTIGGALLCGLPAIFVGKRSLRDIRRSRGRLGGKGMAKTGITLGIVGSICCLLSCAFGGMLGSVTKVRESAARAQSQNNLKQIGIAMHNYHSSFSGLPPGAIYSKEGKPLLSWRVAILPYIEELNLYNQFHLDEPWDSPNNKPLLALMPKVYAAPGRAGQTDQTYYRIFHRKEGASGAFAEDHPVFDGQQSRQFWGITRGTSNTILVVETAESVPWTKPDELPFPVNGPIEPLLGGIFKDRYNVLFADATVANYQKGKVSDKQLKAAITVDSDVLLPPP